VENTHCSLSLIICKLGSFKIYALVYLILMKEIACS